MLLITIVFTVWYINKEITHRNLELYKNSMQNCKCKDCDDFRIVSVGNEICGTCVNKESGWYFKSIYADGYVECNVKEKDASK